MSKQPVTRFAPSPTGYLHIGGARTALFNYLYARRHEGKFLLRVEDTDRERSTQAAVDAILDGMDWLGLSPSESPVFQHSRAKRHIEVAHKLLEKGAAYKCYATPEELDEMRETARKEGKGTAYDGRWRDRSADEAPDNIPPVIRFKAPREGETIIEDAVQGQVTFQNEQLDDFILLRSDQTPTYMLAVIVDDHDMEVSHIIRGDDHLINAARQSQVYDALDWSRPAFTHIPLIHGADGKKLSKRHGAMGVAAYRALGYLPEALRNYLVRLGWSHGDDEIISDEQMRQWFDLEHIGKSPSRFDTKKLDNLNSHYIKSASEASLINHIQTAFRDHHDLHELDVSLFGAEHIKRIEDVYTLCNNLKDEDWENLLRAMPALKERAKTLIDLMENAGFLFASIPLPIHEKAAKHLDENCKENIRKVLPVLEGHEEWTSTSLHELVQNFIEKEDLKLGKIAQPIRAAITGQANSPGAFDVLEAVGKKEALLRLKAQL